MSGATTPGQIREVGSPAGGPTRREAPPSPVRMNPPTSTPAADAAVSGKRVSVRCS